MSLGDFDVSTVIYSKFSTFRPSTGAAFTLGGSPALSVYKDNSTTQSTAGVTLNADFDSVTGLNHYTIDTSADGTFYSAGSFFDVVITTGTVDGVSVVGAVVGRFTLRKNSALKPTTAGRTFDVSTTGEGGLDFDNIKDASSGHTLTNVTIPIVTSITNGVTVAAGGIVAASFGAGAIDSAAIATAAKQSLADVLLARNQQGGSNAAPTVSQALAGGLMLIDIAAGILTVKNGDGTTAYTRTLSRAALDAIINSV